MAKLRAGIIGCGGRGTAHALGYSQSDRVELTACADIHRPAAEIMAERFGIPRIYTDYREMLSELKLDIASMALWPGLHCDAVLACVNAEHTPELINAEKPMAPTFGECVRMHTACEDAGIMLTFSHQRRFGPTFSKARSLLKDGAIGELIRMEGYCSNLLDWGTHWFDMMFFYNDDLPVDWVMGQIDCAEERLVFGALVETSGLSYVKWQNGVTGLLATGADPGGGCVNRLVGTDGVIEIMQRGGVRVIRDKGSGGWEHPELTPAGVPGGETTLHILDSIDCLLAGRESILCSWRALQATELIFATYESARLREKVCLPLNIEDSPLLTMRETGDIAIPDWPAFLTEAEEQEGFSLLFNGTDLSGWSPQGDADAWTAAGGFLRCSGEGTGWVRTTDPFGDFVLRLDYRLLNRGRSSIVVRAGEGGAAGSPCVEVCLVDDRRESVSDMCSGALAGIQAPEVNNAIGGSNWNTIELTCRASSVQVKLNGEDVLSCDLQGRDELKGGRPEGFIGLRNCSAHVDFRNILLKRLT